MTLVDMRPIADSASPFTSTLLQEGLILNAQFLGRDGPQRMVPFGVMGLVDVRRFLVTSHIGGAGEPLVSDVWLAEEASGISFLPKW